MEDEYTPDLISLTDEEGNEYNFEVLDAIETDTARYVALLPMYDDPKKQLDDSGELVILRVNEEGTEDTFYEEIDDDQEYDAIADMFIQRLQDFYEIDSN